MEIPVQELAPVDEQDPIEEVINITASSPLLSEIAPLDHDVDRSSLYLVGDPSLEVDLARRLAVVIGIFVLACILGSAASHSSL